ncbi:NAD(P)H-dependent glycerol-3-phosphate dehydrogenase [Deinococcus lacus]|uniref:Glycerol-3-phosphate dehydrogenase [NAD(P)+] n=1 Tax=Deinococcus lacus TaxID=392561 RepID=A0ABW1YEF6_9DEIO
MTTQRVTVLGAGGWGTALALCAHRTGCQVTLWARRPEAAQELQQQRENRAYLPGVALPASLKVTSDLAGSLQADLLLVVLPSLGVPEMLTLLPPDRPLVLCAKGLAPGGEPLSELAARTHSHLAVLSGPNLAGEIAQGLPAATVVASRDPHLAQAAQQALMSASLRIYTSSDVLGVELGGVLKNVIALAAGMVDGLQLGDNAKAALLTRGLAEMRRYLSANGAQEATLYGLSGLGDLIATASSPQSRNRAAGEALAQGRPLPGKVVEGLRTAALLDQWAQQTGQPMPIAHAVTQVAQGTWSPHEGLRWLMERGAKSELE